MKQTLVETKIMLMSALAGYREWVKGGKKPYGYCDGEQSRHDNYHEEISETDDLNIFEFRIQIYDSPDGDIWCKGKFRLLNGGADIEILNEDLERC